MQILQAKYVESEDIFLKNSLGKIKKQITNAIRIISDLLDVSKIKLGRFSLNKEYFELNLFVKEIVEEIQQINPPNRVEFIMGPEATVFADKEKLSQVVINLLSNAIKYSPVDTLIKIQCETVNKVVTISVTDQGIGISKKDQEKIFERFYRVEGKNEHTYEGFGIGLFIITEIINQHEGTVGVKSELGKGSVFYFTLACN